MKNEYSFDHFQKRRKHIREKNKRTKRRLLMLFLTTFSTVLMMFLVVANIITPEIDIPALNNDYDRMSDIRSSDFKKRVDSRLKQIKVDDDAPARILEKESKDKNKAIKAEAKAEKKKETEESIIKNFFANAEKIKDDIIKLDFSGNNDIQEPPVPEAAPEPEPIPEITQEKPKKQEKPKVVEAPKTPPPPPAAYPPRPIQPKRFKVLVGQFNSPQEAKRLAETIARTNGSGVKPFIKNHNGKYCVQVGSYGNSQKAGSVAGNYQMKSYNVKIVND